MPQENFMFDESKMFEDVARMMDATAADQKPVREAMQPWFDYCRAVAPTYADLWTELEQLPIEEDFKLLTNWVTSLLQDDPPQPEINGLWFGLCNISTEESDESCQLYLSGSTRFDKNDHYNEWPINPEYWPENRYSPSKVMPVIYAKVEAIDGPENYLGECCLCHGYAASVVTNWCTGPTAEIVLGPDRLRGVGTGHDGGDHYIIYSPK